MISGFLEERDALQWAYDRADIDFQVYQGEGSNALEVAVVDLDEQPTKKFLQQAYSNRRGGRPNPILVVVLYGEDAGLCGPSGEEPPVYWNVDLRQVERVCDAALDEPDRHTAQEFLTKTLPRLDEDLTGLRNQGLLSTHELKVGVPERADWSDAGDRAKQALSDDPRELIRGLNYEFDSLTDQSYILKDTSDGHERAVAVFLQEDESFDRAQERFVGQTPVAYALNEADKKNLDYVIGSSGGTLRLYTTDPDAGFGSRGRTDTFVEVNTDLLTDEKAAYLWLLFSADALRDGGTLHDIMERSRDYAADLGARLRERIYDDVVPDLAEAIADARDLTNPSSDDLDETYEMTLILLYRLLFMAYAEDEEFLPRRRNSRYDEHSLKRKARDLHELIQNGGEFDDSFTDHWDDVMHLTRAIHDGHDELGLPAYDGRLLSNNAGVSEAGARLSDIRLSNDEFGPVLVNLLIDETEDGYQGPVDFRNIGVREFGVIYEGLLESELSVAEQPLGTDSDDRYEPVDPDEEPDREIAVEEGEVYLHGQSGERKATGTYYTKTRFVEHLLDYSLEPALDDHIERIERLREEEGDNAAADAFFDIRTADIAMGSGHFLVGAVDRIESRLYSYLTDNPLPPVEEELDNLEDAALAAFENEEYAPNIERGQLLRRQVARRCIYGVDLNPLATELARLSIWVHTFVPGLPLTFLDYNLVAGDALAGVGTLDEVSDVLGVESDQVTFGSFASSQGILDELNEEIKTAKNLADTSAEKVQKARETRERIDEKLAPIRARLDILTAARIDDDINTKTATDTNIEDPTSLSTYEEAQEVLEPFDILHLPTAFPEVFEGDRSGFDAILGNPPWDKVRFEPQQFWVTRHPGLNALPDKKRKERMNELREKYAQQADEERREKEYREQYQEYVKNSFEDQGRGHYDYAKLFVERATDILNDDGELGYVLPRQSLVLAGWKHLRRRVIVDSELTVLQARNTGGWIFENVEPRYMIVLITSSPARGDVGAHVWPAIEQESAMDEIDSSNSIYLSYDDLANLTTEDRLVVPWFNSDGARDVFPKMEDRARLSSEEGWITGTHDAHWDFRSSGPHSDISNDEDEPDYWRVFMTRSVDQFEINVEKEFRRFVDPEDLYDADDNVVKTGSEIMLGPNHPTVTFRHVSRNDDTRTIIATMLPEKEFIYCKGYVHAVAHEEGTSPEKLLALLAYFNSYTCDWWARRILDRHVTSPSINNLPIPEWDEAQIREAASLSAELTRRGGIDTLPGGNPVPEDTGHRSTDESEIRAQIEQLVANGFDLGREELDTVLSDFTKKACSDELRGRIRKLVEGDSVETVAGE